LFSSARNNGGVVQVGAQTRGSTDDGSVYTAVVEQVPHPDYKRNTQEFDFMILKLGGWVSELNIHTSPGHSDINSLLPCVLSEIVQGSKRPRSVEQ
jgi:hypothetical protein